MENEAIAKVCHEANRAYCEGLGDHSQRPWSESAEWQRESAVEGVQFVLNDPGAPASASHESWMYFKLKGGWTYGEEKDAEAKTHPCIVPFAELPAEQQKKDALFRAVVLAIQGL